MPGSLDFGFGWLLRAVKPVEIEALWRQFFEDPSQWSDVRTQKVPYSVPLNFVLELPEIIPNFVPHLKLQVTSVASWVSVDTYSSGFNISALSL